MSRLADALRRAQTGSAVPDSFNGPSTRALDWFDAFDEAVPVRTAAPEPAHPRAAPVPPSPPAGERAPIPARPERGTSGSLAALAGTERLVINPGTTPIAVEQYRRLGAALHQAQRDRSVRVVMVASALPGDGKTITTANLALTLSESYRRRVLIVDADLRRPMIHQMFRVDNRQGLNDVLMAIADRKLPIVAVSSQLSILPAGSPNPDPMGALTSERMRRVLAEAAEQFDWVILDTPPIGLLPDASLLAAMMDGAVLVVAAGHTPAKMAAQAADALGRQRVIGVVLNRADENDVASAYARDRDYREYATGGEARRP